MSFSNSFSENIKDCLIKIALSFYCSLCKSHLNENEENNCKSKDVSQTLREFNSEQYMVKILSSNGNSLKNSHITGSLVLPLPQLHS